MEITFPNEANALYFSDSLLLNIENENNTEVLSMLRTASPSHLTDLYGSTLLHVAARYNNVWLARYLIDLGAEVDALNHAKETPLMVAVTHRQVSIVTLLLEANADIFVPDKSGRCALGKALVDKDRVGYESPADYGAWKICKNIVAALLNRVTTESLSSSKHIGNEIFHVDCPLYYFMPLKNAEVTRILLEKGSSVNARDPKTGIASLHKAVEKLDVENVKLLLQHGADVKMTSRSGRAALAFFLHLSDQAKVLAIFEMLLEAGASLIDREHGKIFVKDLLSDGDNVIVRSVLKCKMDLHFVDADGHTALHYLAKNYAADTLAELRGFDFDVNVRTRDCKRTMLYWAATRANASSIQFLLDRGADVNATCCFDYSPLSSIIMLRRDGVNFSDVHVNCIEILLAGDADPEILTERNYWRLLPALSEPISDAVVAVMDPIFAYLAAAEASGRTIGPRIGHCMQSVILSVPQFRKIFDSKKLVHEQLKEVKIDKSLNLLDFLMANEEKISLYARNRRILPILFGVVKKNNLEPCFKLKLCKNFSKFTELVELRKRAATTLDIIFGECYNISVYNIAEKIIGYLEDQAVHKLL